MKESKRSGKTSRREFLRKNLLVASAFFVGALAKGAEPTLKDKDEGPNVGMKPARFYKELAG